MSMMLGLWNDFSNWITNTWSDVTFLIVVSIFGILGLLALLSFFKGNFDKGKKVKWLKLVFALVMFGLLTLLCCVKYV